MSAASRTPGSVGAGRGILFISFAKLWFMVTGYVIQFGLPRALTPEQFGVWILVLALVSPINNVVVTATIQGVSRFVAESDERAGAVVRSALRLQLLIGGGVALAFFAAAPWIAAFLKDDALVPLLRIVAGVVLCYSFYAVFVGAANGARAFHKQAGLDIGFSTLRAALVVGGAVLLHAVSASVTGFVLASATIVAASVLVVGVPRGGSEPFPVRRLAGFFGQLALYLLLLNLLMFVDGVLLKRLVTEHALATHVEDPVGRANLLEGFYGAAQNVARIPYQLIVAVAFVIFPLVSRSTFERDEARTRSYVSTTLRYTFVVTVLLAVSLGTRPAAILRVLYARPGYDLGAAALVLLLVGYVAFSLFAIAGTILNGAGMTSLSWRICLGTLIVSAGATWWAIRYALASGHDVLAAAALATASAMLVGCGLALVALWRRFGAVIPASTIGRVTVCGAAVLGLGRVWPEVGLLGGKIGAVLSAGAGALLFLALAVATGELRVAELRRLRSAGAEPPAKS